MDSLLEISLLNSPFLTSPKISISLFVSSNVDCQIKVGDRVRIKAGGLSGKTGTVQQITQIGKGKAKVINAVVSSDEFGMPQTIPVNHLEEDFF